MSVDSSRSLFTCSSCRSDLTLNVANFNLCTWCMWFFFIFRSFASLESCNFKVSTAAAGKLRLLLVCTLHNLVLLAYRPKMDIAALIYNFIHNMYVHVYESNISGVVFYNLQRKRYLI